MSFIDDFIYKVKTGRLFAGSDKQEGVSQKIEALESKLEIIERTHEGFKIFEDKIGVIDEMDKEIMVLETKVEALKEKNKETVSTEPPSESPEVEQQAETQSTKDKPLDIQQSVKKQIGPDVVIHFVFMEKTYIVERFNLNFRQDLNTLKNRPDSFTYGGTMQITLSGFLDSSLDEWLTQTYQTRDGEIHFFANMPKITDSALLSLFFTDAYCTACNKMIDTATNGVLTTLIVSPRNIKIGNEEFENRWKAKEPLEFTIKSV